MKLFVFSPRKIVNYFNIIFLIQPFPLTIRHIFYLVFIFKYLYSNRVSILISPEKFNNVIARTFTNPALLIYTDFIGRSIFLLADNHCPTEKEQKQADRNLSHKIPILLYNELNTIFCNILQHILHNDTNNHYPIYHYN